MATIETATYTETWDGAKLYLKERLKLVPGFDKGFDITVIDVGLSFSASIHDGEAVATKVEEAYVTSAFFYVTSHRIDDEGCDSILTQAQRFFKDLPKSKKQALDLKKSAYGHGWEDAASTRLHGDAEKEEDYNWSYENEPDLTGGDGGYVQLDGRSVTRVNQWPDEKDLPGFHGGIKAYYGPALQLARHLSMLFALSLNLPESYFDNMITQPSGNARLMYYPSCGDDQASLEKDIGLGAHSDYQCWTILLCDAGWPIFCDNWQYRYTTDYTA